jgi:hypothetical protein
MATTLSRLKDFLLPGLNSPTLKELNNMCGIIITPPASPPRDPDPDGIDAMDYDLSSNAYLVRWKSGLTETITAREIAMDKEKSEALNAYKAALMNAQYAQALQNTTSISGLAGTGMLGVPTTIGSGLMGTASINPYGSYTIPSTGSFSGLTTITYDGIPGVQTATPAKTRQKLTGGDLIVCKNDHPICIVMEDFEVGSEGDWRSKMGFWQQDKTSTDLSPQDYDCEICKASFTRAAPEYLPGHAFIVRPAPKEETESE